MWESKHRLSRIHIRARARASHVVRVDRSSADSPFSFPASPLPPAPPAPPPFSFLLPHPLFSSSPFRSGPSPPPSFSRAFHHSRDPHEALVRCPLAMILPARARAVTEAPRVSRIARGKRGNHRRPRTRLCPSHAAIHVCVYELRTRKAGRNVGNVCKWASQVHGFAIRPPSRLAFARAANNGL